MTDYTEYKKLYLLSFTDDTEEDAELLFKNVLSKANCVCEYDEKGSPIAMLFLMDTNILIENIPHPYYYLYAACTHPDYRGRGIMGRLLDKARQEAIKNNKEGIFLKPANKSLFDFYAKYGFYPYFKIWKINTSTEDFSKTFNKFQDSFAKTTLEDWQVVRKSFLSLLSDGYVDFSKEILTTAADGSIPIKSENFGFVYEMRETTLLVKEALCKKEYINQLFNAISNVAIKNKATDLEIRLPVTLKGQIPGFSNLIQDFSVIWFAEKELKKNLINPYHGFAFD